MDLLLEVVSDSQPLYLYASIIVSVYCAYQLYRLHSSKWIIRNNNAYWRSIHAHEAQLNTLNPGIVYVKTIHQWLALKTNRIEISDDDTEPASLLLTYKMIANNKEDNNDQICIHFYPKI